VGAVFASKMTYIVSDGALNSTHSLVGAVEMVGLIDDGDNHDERTEA